MRQLRIAPERLHRRLEELAGFGGLAEGGVTRIAFSEPERQARAYMQDLMRQAGLEIRCDPAGNLFGRLPGSADPRVILFGSHIDTVPRGGRYDGALGSLAAVEVLQTLTDSRYVARHPLEVAIWCEEERGLTGSRAFVGTLPEVELAELRDDGRTLAEHLVRVGGDPSRLREAKAAGGAVAAYVELHIEQGCVLETERIDIGVVEGFVTINHYHLTVSGVANHAGTTPMRHRRDALIAAGDIVLAVNRIVVEEGGGQVGTVGELTVHPGAPNVVPGRVDLTIELRDLERERIEATWERIRQYLDEVGARRGTPIQSELHQSLSGARTDATIRRTVAGAAERLGLSTMTMPSGAGHDAQTLARICPTGMIFVPSVGGISHSPDELTLPRDVENGANVLLHTVLELDER